MKFLHKNRIITFDYVISRKKNKLSNEKNRQSLTSKTEHTDVILRFNSEYTVSAQTKNIPNLSFVQKRL